MDQQREKFLNLKDKPARLSAEETAWYLGFAIHDIPVLVAKGLLKPLGHPRANSIKFFAFTVLEHHRHDPKWLANATNTIANYWQTKNARKTKSKEELEEVTNAVNRVVATVE